MATKLNKRKESNLLFLKKDSNYFSSISSLNSQLSPNFHLNTLNKKDKAKSKKVNNHMNNITKINNYQNKKIDNTFVSNFIKNSPISQFKTSNFDFSNSNDINIKNKGKDNLSKDEQKDSQNKKGFFHKKINSHLFIKNNQILNEIFQCHTATNLNKPKESLFNNKKKNASKILRKKHIQIDTYNINNNTNLNNNNTTKKIITSLSNNLNNQNKLNLKIYLEKHSRVLSTDDDKSIANSKNQKCEKKNNINSVIKSNRLILNKLDSRKLLNNLNYKTNTLSRANSSCIQKEIDIFKTSLEFSFSKNKKNKINYKNKKNNVVTNNINNFIKEKQLKISDNDLKRNDLLSLDKLKEKTALYYLTNISEEFKAKKKNYNGNNIFISINNYTNDNKRKKNKSNINLTEGKDNSSMQNYLAQKSISQKGIDNARRRNYLKKKDNKYRILSGSKNSSENRTEENFNSYNSDNDKITNGPEMTHFYIVASIQKGIRNIHNYN